MSLAIMAADVHLLISYSIDDDEEVGIRATGIGIYSEGIESITQCDGSYFAEVMRWEGKGSYKETRLDFLSFLRRHRPKLFRLVLRDDEYEEVLSHEAKTP